VKFVLDACVLYPTVLREILLGTARAGAFVPVWSARILEEWTRAAARRSAADAEIAAGEIALVRAEWPDAEIALQPETEARLWLPDPDDVHVLATAIDSGADGIVTLNLRDFPRRELDPHGLALWHPDPFLLGHLSMADPVARAVHARAEELAGEVLPLRALLKRARLPRLGKAVAG
jgi:predicted nucleic acid-binding protein